MQAGRDESISSRTGRAPGAMTQAMSAWVTASERVVRVALTRGDRIEIEKLTAQTLRIGPRESADLIVRDARYGGRLFVRTKQGWTLRVPEGVQGKLANGGPVRPIDPGPAREIELAPDARGRLETAEGALLFQLVVPPPAMPAPQLPASVQHGVFGAIDWHFTTITIAVFMLFFGATVMLEAADWPMAGSPLGDPDFQTVIAFIEPEPPPDPAATWAQQDPIPETDDPETDAEPDPAPQPQRADRPSRTNRPATPEAESSLSQDDIRRGVALTIAALTPDGESGAFTDLIRDGAPTTRHADLFANIEGVQTFASTNPLPRDTHRCVGEGCSDRPGDIQGIRRPTQIAVAGPDEHRPLGDVRGLPMDPIDVDDDFDPAALVRRIRGKSRQIARCYEGHLTRHPDLRGRVDAEVTVMPAGNVRIEITGNTTGSDAVGDCVDRHLRTIRLTRGPERHPVTLGFPFVFSAQR